MGFNAEDHFRKEPANSFTSDQHADPLSDYVMAKPPFNISEWWDTKLEGDPHSGRVDVQYVMGESMSRRPRTRCPYTLKPLTDLVRVNDEHIFARRVYELLPPS